MAHAADPAPRSPPLQVIRKREQDFQIITIACGARHTLALSSAPRRLTRAPNMAARPC